MVAGLAGLADSTSRAVLKRAEVAIAVFQGNPELVQPNQVRGGSTMAVDLVDLAFRRLERRARSACSRASLRVVVSSIPRQPANPTQTSPPLRSAPRTRA